jgi:hypothetical protein
MLALMGKNDLERGSRPGMFQPGGAMTKKFNIVETSNRILKKW